MVPYGVWLPELLKSQRLDAGTQAASGEVAPDSAASATSPTDVARQKRARSSVRHPSENPADGPLLRWLPETLVKLSRRLVSATPFAPSTRFKPQPEPEPEPPGGKQR